jgi:hypothetical protein
MAARVALSRSLPRQSIMQIARKRPHARFNSSQSAPPPPPPPKSGSWTLPIIGGLALIGAGGYYYYKNSGSADGTSPISAYPVATAKKVTKEIVKPGDYQAVYNVIAAELEEGADEYDDGSFGPVILRLAWHSSGSYDKETGTGGSNGATMVISPNHNILSYFSSASLPSLITLQMPVSKSLAIILKRSSNNSLGLHTGIFGLLLEFVRSKKWVVLSFLGGLVALIKNPLIVLPMVVFLMDQREVDTFEISFTAWVSMIKKSLLLSAPMPLDDAIPIDLDIRGYMRNQPRHANNSPGLSLRQS